MSDCVSGCDYMSVCLIVYVVVTIMSVCLIVYVVVTILSVCLIVYVVVTMYWRVGACNSGLSQSLNSYSTFTPVCLLSFSIYLSTGALGWPPPLGRIGLALFNNRSVPVTNAQPLGEWESSCLLWSVND